jgi:hypothetical protein
MSSTGDATILSDRIAKLEMKLEVAKKVVTILSACVVALFGAGFFALLKMAKDQAVAVVLEETKKQTFTELEKEAKGSAENAEKAATAAAGSATKARGYERNISDMIQGQRTLTC